MAELQCYKHLTEYFATALEAEPQCYGHILTIVC